MSLGRRTQILLDDDRHRRLDERSRRTGASIGSLIRDAIDLAYPAAPTDRERAARALLAAPPMPVPEGYENLKAEIEGAHVSRGF